MLNIKPITQKRLEESNEKLSRINAFITKYNLVYNPQSGRYDCFGNFIFEQSFSDDDCDIATENGHFIIPLGTILGDFVCTHCHTLTSMKNAPKEVIGNFECQFCENLESLEGSPQIVEGTFDCSHCVKLKSLNGAPYLVGNNYVFDYCESLVDLNGMPQNIQNNVSFTYCSNLKTLEGAPQTVARDFDCSGCNNLQSLEHLPTIGGKVDVPFHLMDSYFAEWQRKSSPQKTENEGVLKVQNIERLVDKLSKNVSSAFVKNKYF
jgi:hypothetical protein